MGFDIYGLNPSSGRMSSPDWKNEDEVKEYFKRQDKESGHYFRNNVWYWRPLWDFIVEQCGDILSEDDITGGYNNGGHKLPKSKAVKIRNRIDELDKEGKIEEWEIEYKKKIDEAPDEQCYICEGTGTLDADTEPKKCFRCDGKGRKKPFYVNYPFSRENVMEFREFLDNCGGFEIC